jgi:nicotinamide-nucleotide amidase
LTVARAAQKQTGATHALAVLVNVDEGGDRVEFAGTTCLAIATANDLASRRSHIVGGLKFDYQPRKPMP